MTPRGVDEPTIWVVNSSTKISPKSGTKSGTKSNTKSGSKIKMMCVPYGAPYGFKREMHHTVWRSLKMLFLETFKNEKPFHKKNNV